MWLASLAPDSYASRSGQLCQTNIHITPLSQMSHWKLSQPMMPTAQTFPSMGE